MSEPALPGREARGPSARSVTIRSYACPITLYSFRVPYYQREEKHSQDLRIHLETTTILSSGVCVSWTYPEHLPPCPHSYLVLCQVLLSLHSPFGASVQVRVEPLE